MTDPRWLFPVAPLGGSVRRHTRSADHSERRRLALRTDSRVRSDGD